MKRLFKSLFLGFLGLYSLLILGVPSFSSADDGWGGFTQNTKNVEGIGAMGTAEGNVNSDGKGLINTIKQIIKWILGILSLITLILLLYGGFNMVTAAGDESKFRKGFTILKQAGVGLAFIALSWMIVSLIFYVIKGSAKEAGGNSGAVQNTSQILMKRVA